MIISTGKHQHHQQVTLHVLPYMGYHVSVSKITD